MAKFKYLNKQLRSATTSDPVVKINRINVSNEGLVSGIYKPISDMLSKALGSKNVDLKKLESASSSKLAQLLKKTILSKEWLSENGDTEITFNPESLPLTMLVNDFDSYKSNLDRGIKPLVETISKVNSLWKKYTSNLKTYIDKLWDGDDDFDWDFEADKYSEEYLAELKKIFNAAKDFNFKVNERILVSVSYGDFDFDVKFEIIDDESVSIKAKDFSEFLIKNIISSNLVTNEHISFGTAYFDAVESFSNTSEFDEWPGEIKDLVFTEAVRTLKEGDMFDKLMFDNPIHINEQIAKITDKFYNPK